MKFTYFLLQNVVPEWIKLYVNFKLLKTYLTVSTLIKQMLIKAKKTKSKQIYRIIKQTLMENEIIMEKLERDNHHFTKTFHREAEKVHNFAKWKYNDILIKSGKILEQVKLMEKYREKMKTQTTKFGKFHRFQTTWNMKDDIHEQVQPLIPSSSRQNQKDFDKKSNDLKDTFFFYYIEVRQFSSYVELNTDGIRKILKKYKKQQIKGIRQAQDEKTNFGQVQQIQKLLKQIPQKMKVILDETEKQMIQNFYPDNPKYCREQLRKYTEKQELKMKTVFYFGFFAGFAVVFVMILALLRYDGYLDPNGDKVFNKVFPCFRGMALFVIYAWCLAIDVWGWNYFNINYKLFLGFNYHFSTLSDILRRASVLTAIYLVVFVVYCMQVEDLGRNYVILFTTIFQFIDPRLLPLIPWFIGIVYIFIPTKTELNGEGRRWMFRMFAGSIWGHFVGKSESSYTLFTDQFGSMVTSLRDFDYTVCYYKHLFINGSEHTGECNYQHRITSALPNILPQLFKCLQYLTRAKDKKKFWNTDEMYNFLKTSLELSVGVLSFMARQDRWYRYVWIPVATTSSITTYWWDLKKDFLFFEPNSKYKFLRNDLGYNSPNIYYTLAVLNLFLRASWVLSISPDIYKAFRIKNEIFVLLIGFLEMTRSILKLQITNFPRINKQFLEDRKRAYYEFKIIESSLRFEVSVYLSGCYRTIVCPYNYQQCFRNIIVKHDEVLSRPSVSTIHNKESIEKKSKYGYSMFRATPAPAPEEINLPDDVSLRQLPSQIMDEKRTSSNKLGIPRKISYEQFPQVSLVLQNRGHDNSFRLTMVLEQDDKKENELEFCHSNVQMEILETAKKQEKMEFQKILQLKEENFHYKELIKDLYMDFGIKSV